MGKLPRIFHVNWFRKDASGKFLWPGYGENVRVLKWVFDRCNKGVGDEVLGVKTAIGYLPTAGSIDRAGLPVADGEMRELLRVDGAAWRGEIGSIRAHYGIFGERLPQGLVEELESLERGLEGV